MDETYSKEKIYELYSKNMAACQKIEILFKFLLSRTSIKLKIGAPNNHLQTWKESKDTLGRLLNKYYKEHNSTIEYEIEPDKPELNFYFRYPESISCRKDNMDKFISIRNELAHQFFIKFNLSEEESRKLAFNYLNETYNFIKNEYYIIQKDAIFVDEFFPKAMNETLNIMILYVKIRQKLLEAHEKFKDSNGWTNVSHAGRVLNQFYNNEDSVLKEIKSKGLYNYIETSNQFEVKKEKQICKYRPKAESENFPMIISFEKKS